jgi:hypothetical protein
LAEANTLRLRSSSEKKDKYLMYDPSQGFPELNDPAFWKAIAAQVDVYPLPDERWPYPQPVQSGSRLLPAPRAEERNYPVPTFQPTQQNDQPAQQPPLIGIVCALGICLILLVLVFSRPQPAQPPPQPQQKTLTRLSQWDAQQYNSPGDVAIWGPSACSAAAMTEVINYYGHSYRIGDILAVEYGLHQITTKLGLLYGFSSIQSTVAHFHFQATQLASPTVSSIVSLANSGVPVIISFPPSTWPGGHILLVSGGNASQVYLVDSSSLDMKEMNRQTFLQRYWRGFAVVVKPK